MQIHINILTTFACESPVLRNRCALQQSRTCLTWLQRLPPSRRRRPCSRPYQTRTNNLRFTRFCRKCFRLDIKSTLVYGMPHVWRESVLVDLPGIMPTGIYSYRYHTECRSCHIRYSIKWALGADVPITCCVFAYTWIGHVFDSSCLYHHSVLVPVPFYCARTQTPGFHCRLRMP